LCAGLIPLVLQREDTTKKQQNIQFLEHQEESELWIVLINSFGKMIFIIAIAVFGGIAAAVTSDKGRALIAEMRRKIRKRRVKVHYFVLMLNDDFLFLFV